MDRTNKNDLFETMKPARALAVMAVPTIASQLIVLVYNLADTWFIGRTNNPYMIGASSLVLTLYLAAVALANVFGVGGGSLMARLMGEKKDGRSAPRRFLQRRRGRALRIGLFAVGPGFHGSVAEAAGR